MNKVLIVVDYQKDFVDGVIRNKAARDIEFRICEKIEKYRSAGDDVIFTMDTHTPEDRGTREFSDLQPLHCVEGTEGWQIYGRVARYLPMAKHLVRKNTYGSIELARLLREGAYDVVELVGVTAHACVFSNAIIAASALPFAQVLVDPDCTASTDEGQKQSALWMLENLHIQVRSEAEEGLSVKENIR